MTTTITEVEIPTTEQIIERMLTENTGRHFLDSGGAYGRNWERNQGRDFESEPVVGFGGFGHGEDADVWPVLSLFHFLKDRLEYDHDLTVRMDEEVIAESEESYLADAETFAAMLHDPSLNHELGMEPRTFNSYNYESHLSQVIQWVEFAYAKPDEDGEPGFEELYCVLSVHGGCDVRGGYTRPYVFKMAGNYALVMEDLQIFCTAGGSHQPTLDGKEVWVSDCPLGSWSIDFRGSEATVYVRDAGPNGWGEEFYDSETVNKYQPTRDEDDRIVCRGCGSEVKGDLNEYSW
jgi:hypothetical protein